MARKRLSDLLREEEQKGGEKAASKSSASESNADDNASPSPEAPQEVAESDSAEPVVVVTSEVIDPTQADRTGKSGSELRSAAVEEPEPTPQTDQTALENTALKDTIEQLKVELQSLQQKAQAAQAQEAALQAQIERLKAETTTQQSQIQQLQTEVEQSAQLKTELEEAKQMILKLSQPQPQANKPAANQPAATKPAKPSPTVLPTVRAAEPELDSKPVEMVIPPHNAASERPKLHQMALRKVLDHPTQPGSLPPMSSETKKPEKEVKLSDADVGWMD